MKKRLLSIILSLSLCLGLLPAVALAASIEPHSAIMATLFNHQLDFTKGPLDLSTVSELNQDGVTASGTINLTQDESGTYFLTLDHVNASAVDAPFPGVDPARPYIHHGLAVAVHMIQDERGYLPIYKTIPHPLKVKLVGENKIDITLPSIRGNVTNNVCTSLLIVGFQSIEIFSPDRDGTLETKNIVTGKFGPQSDQGINISSSGILDIHDCVLLCETVDSEGHPFDLSAANDITVGQGARVTGKLTYTDTYADKNRYHAPVSIDCPTLTMRDDGVIESISNVSRPNTPFFTSVSAENYDGRVYAGPDAEHITEVSPDTAGFGDVWNAVTSYEYFKLVSGTPQPPVQYPIWVSGEQVTLENCDDIGGSGTVSYDPVSNVLTMDHADITAVRNPLYGDNSPNDAALYVGQKDLTIRLIGDNKLTGPNTQCNSYGLLQYSSIDDTGITLVNGNKDGSVPTLTVTGSTVNNTDGISAGMGMKHGNLNVNHVSVTSVGEKTGIEFDKYSTKQVTVDQNGVITALADVYPRDRMDFYGGGSLLASGSDMAISGSPQVGARLRMGDPLDVPSAGDIDLKTVQQIEVTNPAYFTRDGRVVKDTDILYESNYERTFTYALTGGGAAPLQWDIPAEYGTAGVKAENDVLTIPANFVTIANQPITVTGHRDDINSDVVLKMEVHALIPTEIIGVTALAQPAIYTGQPAAGYTGTAAAAAKDVTGEIKVYYEGTGGTTYPKQETAPAACGTYQVIFELTGDQKYKASKELSFTIAPAPIHADGTQAVVSVSGEYTYDGTEKRPTADQITVTFGGETLVPEQDYTVQFQDNTGAGTGIVTVTGTGNYSGTVTGEFTIKPAPLTLTGAVLADKTYDGTTAAAVSGVTLEGYPEHGVRLTAEDYQVSGTYADPNAGTGTAAVTLRLADTANAKNYMLAPGGASLTLTGQTIRPAQFVGQPSGELYISNRTEHSYTLPILPLIALPAGQTLGTVSSSVSEGSSSGPYQYQTGMADGTILELHVTRAEGDTEISLGTVTVELETQNFGTVAVPVTIHSINKLVPTGAPVLSTNQLTYGQTLDTIVLSGSLEYGQQQVPGQFSWVLPDTAYPVGSHWAEWSFAPEDSTAYMEVTGRAELQVVKARPTGTPEFTQVTSGGKTLADVPITTGTIRPEGTISWNDPADTKVEANQSYGWTFTPNDTNNYELLADTAVIYPYTAPSGGGGYRPQPKPDVTVNPDGTKTETITKPDGTTVATTKNQDGSKTVVETRKDGTRVETQTSKAGDQTVTRTKPDGSAETTVKQKDGTRASVSTDADGRTEAQVTLSRKALEQAGQEPLPLPIPSVEASGDPEQAPVVEVKTGSKKPVNISIPVADPGPGTVAVLVREDGSRKVVRKSLSGEQSISLEVHDGDTVMILDNTKQFHDVPETHWAADVIDFVTSHELYNGTGENQFSPELGMSRAMLAMVLYNLEDNPESHSADFADVPDDAWYTDAVGWAAEQGIVNGIGNGFNPDGLVTREQVAVMLYRFAGSPVHNGTELEFDDASQISGYANDAMIWAVENGIMGGMGNHLMAPQGTATRAQVAAMLMRFVNL